MSARNLNDEIRRLQKIYALLISIQHSANYEVEFSVSDALAVVVKLLDKSIARLDRLELQFSKEVAA